MNLIRDKKKSGGFRAVACILAGCVILTGGVFANIDNANGYSAYKNAAKKLIKLNNAAISLTAEMYVDDRALGIMRNDIKVDGESSHMKMTNQVMGDGEYSTESYEDARFSVSRHSSSLHDDMILNTYIYAKKPEETDTNDTFNVLLGKGVDEKLVDKAVRFAEITADSLIGDIKNNFVFLGEENGEKHYNVTLSKEQMPGIVTSGFSLLCGVISNQNSLPDDDTENAREYNYDDINDIIEMIFINEKEPYIKSASCDFRLDGNGNLTSNTLSGTLAGYTLDGAEHTLSVRLGFEITDIGATAVDMFDVYNATGAVLMLDGTTKSFEELTNTVFRISVIDGINRISFYNNYNRSNDDIFIVNGREVSNSEYNDIIRKEAALMEKAAEKAEDMELSRSDIQNILETAEADGYLSDGEIEKISEILRSGYAASIGIIGGADGPTAVYVTDNDKSGAMDAEFNSADDFEDGETLEPDGSDENADDSAADAKSE